MKKAGIVAAERELEWTTAGWHAVKVAWEQELKGTWANFSNLVDDNVSNNVKTGTAAFSAFVGSENPRTLQNFNEARRGWCAFLLHANRVFSKLEQGAKGTASLPWHGTIRRARKKDPLLQYIYQARDAENHGDPTLGQDTVVKCGAPNVQMLSAAEFPVLEARIIGATVGLPMLLLLPVKTRSGIYTPPTRHFEQDIRPSIEVVAELTLTYLAQIITDAKSRMI